MFCLLAGWRGFVLLFALLTAFGGLGLGQNVRLLYSADNPVIGPTPSGDRPRLENADCGSPACAERAAVNRLDGYGLEPLIRVRFSGPIRPDSARSAVFLLWGNARQTNGFTTYPPGYIQPINQVAWDPNTFTLYAKPDEPLDYDRDFTLVITDALVDANGFAVTPPVNRPVIPDGLATTFRPATVLAYTTFHTQNAVRSLVETSLGPSGTLKRTLSRVIDLTQVRTLSILSQTAADPAAPLTVTPLPVDISFIQALGLRRLAFFQFRSTSGVDVYFHVWFPAAAPPASGYPATFIGHGSGDSRFFGPTLLASAVAANSAVFAMDAVGHGFGPNSRIRFTLSDGSVVEVPLPGRGVDVNGDGAIAAGEGCILGGPGNPTFLRTCLRQTALDWRKVAQEIRSGIDLDGDGRPDVDASRIGYFGQSLGSFYGTLLTALEPSIQTAVMNVGGGSGIEASRYSASFGADLKNYVLATWPEFLPDPTKPLPDPFTRRWAPAQVLTDPRQGPYLEFLDRVAALETDSAPASYAPLLKQASLYGNPIKRVLFQFAIGDQVVPNPANFQLMRAAFEYTNVSLYRHDLARQQFPSLPADPHTFLAAFLDFTSQPSLLIGIAALSQSGAFLTTGQLTFPTPLFEPYGADPKLVFP